MSASQQSGGKDGGALIARLVGNLGHFDVKPGPIDDLVFEIVDGVGAPLPWQFPVRYVDGRVVFTQIGSQNGPIPAGGWDSISGQELLAKVAASIQAELVRIAKLSAGQARLGLAGFPPSQAPIVGRRPGTPRVTHAVLAVRARHALAESHRDNRDGKALTQARRAGLLSGVTWTDKGKQWLERVDDAVRVIKDALECSAGTLTLEEMVNAVETSGPLYIDAVNAAVLKLETDRAITVTRRPKNDRARRQHGFSFVAVRAQETSPSSSTPRP